VYPQTRAPAAPISTRTIVIVVVLITLAITVGMAALAFFRGPVYGGSLAIAHTPPKPPLTVGMGTLTLNANVTGSNLQNVTLTYRVIEQAPKVSGAAGGVILGNLVSVPMLLRAAGCTGTCTYSYTLPPSEVSGLYIQYYITAFDTSTPPNLVRTDVYTINIGDFTWLTDKTDATVVRTVTATASLPLSSINGFSQPVTIRIVTQPPLGVSIAPTSVQVVPPNPAVLTITTADNAQIVYNYDMEVDAVYAQGAVQIIRSTILELTVTDFDMALTPTYLKATRCTDTCLADDAVYTLTLTVYDELTSPSGFKISVNGLPDHTSYEILLVSDTISNDHTTTLTYALRVHADVNATADKYLFTVTISSQFVSHDTSKQATQLEIV
jgi:hypothetical protein